MKPQLIPPPSELLSSVTGKQNPSAQHPPALQETSKPYFNPTGSPTQPRHPPASYKSLWPPHIPWTFQHPPKPYICATAPPLFTPQTPPHPSGSHLTPISPSALLSHYRHSCQCPALPALSPGTLHRMEEEEEKRPESPHCCYYVVPAWLACCNDTLAIVKSKVKKNPLPYLCQLLS